MPTSNPHAAILCSPGMGHIIPFLELAKRLVTHKIIPTITFFLISTKNTSETHLLRSAMKENLFNIVQLPPPDITHLIGPNSNNVGLKLATLMKQIAPLLCSTIRSMKSKPPIIFITDLFGCSTLPIADKLKMSKYVFMTSNAWNLALSLHTPILDEEIQGEYIDHNKPIPIPGCKPINPMDLFDPLKDRTHQLYQEYLGMCQELRMADGIFVNSFLELEPKTFSALSNGKIAKVPVYPVGPLIGETRSKNGEEKRIIDVIDWLDKKDEDSVVYISLGSGYRMSYEQIKEMAMGLELSGKTFVWAVRPPVTKAGNDHYLTAGEDALNNSFPDEFYRIQKMGIMVMEWAPQLDILRHKSVGGFLSHCGWNSVLESVSCGVPMIGLPLFADQRMNAAFIADEVGIGIRVEVPMSTNLVGREEIAKAIRKIMNKEDQEGCEIRNKVKELKDIAERAWCPKLVGQMMRERHIFYNKNVICT